ncbi:uncharacterized protein LOC114942152 [Nylanderia fulva]|uniref:uncharacterized protein LOC114942152 n=1 Tax=Nylanderia fulva TaxID=613905 RepID=UPI0010FB3AC8|nr:uncharacterized protein LOC114942152 [Nylanderia fulva]
MDDILPGASTLQEAKEILRQLVLVCKAGGFPLKKWSANHPQLLSTLPTEDCLQQEARWWLPGASPMTFHATLGLRWQPCDDLFSFATSQPTLSTITKRSVLSLTAKLFDPLGWLSPTTVLAKTLIQSTWLLGIDWDTPLPDDHEKAWLRFQAELPQLERLHVPRWLGGGSTDCRLEVHGFADASVRAYAAVVHLKTEKNGEYGVTLIAAKTKVAPLKQISLPRLELSAATLLVRLVQQTLPLIGAEKAPLHLWSDSTVALGWIRGHPSSWVTFVANRVSEIQTSLPDALWHHVPGRENPADCASRGIFPGELEAHPLWWKGPSWLKTESGPWTVFGDDPSNVELPDRRARSHATVFDKRGDEPELLLQYSSLQRLLRITAWCLRWLRQRRRQPILLNRDGGVDAEELHDALIYWIRVVQAVNFKDELKSLRGLKSLPNRSPLNKLSPFVDDSGVIRVGGRLRHFQMSFEATHPIILPSSSRITHLVIDAHHRRSLHGGTQLTLCSIRQEFWIPRGRSLVKNHIHRCVRCLRWRSATAQPLMGDLPAPRVTP